MRLRTTDSFERCVKMLGASVQFEQILGGRSQQVVDYLVSLEYHVLHVTRAEQP